MYALQINGNDKQNYSVSKTYSSQDDPHIPLTINGNFVVIASHSATQLPRHAHLKDINNYQS